MNKNNPGKSLGKSNVLFALLGVLIIMLILVLGSIWMGQGAKKDSQQAVNTISHLYLDELAGRREQVVADNLQKRIADMQTALDLMSA